MQVQGFLKMGVKEDRRPKTPFGVYAACLKPWPPFGWLVDQRSKAREKGTQEINELLKEEHQVPLESLHSSLQTPPPAVSPLSQSLLGQMSHPPTGKALRTEFLWLLSKLGNLSSSWVLHHQASLFPSTRVPNKSTSPGTGATGVIPEGSKRSPLQHFCSVSSQVKRGLPLEFLSL